MQKPQPQPADRREDPVIAVIEPALRAGAACGFVGFIFGGTSGIIRGVPPVLFGGVAAIQTFTLGTTFSALRSSLIRVWTTDDRPPPPQDLMKASAFAGGVSGGIVGLLTRGRSNAIPGTIMFAIFGAAGQHLYNRWTTPKDTKPKENFWKRAGEKSWVPFKVLTNEEYAEMLQEKLLKVDVEIAVLDDKIAALKDHQSRSALEASQELISKET